MKCSFVCALALALSAWAGPNALSPSKPTAKQRAIQKEAKQRLARTPLYFEPNQGQTDPRFRFLARGAGFLTFLDGQQAVFVNKATTKPIRLRFLDSQAPLAAAGEDKLAGISNYFIGSDPQKWRTDVPHFRRVRFRNVYEGVDAVFYSDAEGRMEYDFVVHPGGDPSRVQLTWEGVEQMKLSPEGDLVLTTSAGEIIQKQPVVYQEFDGVRVAVKAHYVLKGNRVEFALSAWDRTKPLVMDPALLYSTYLGGAAEDEAYAIAVDPQGPAYVVGSTASANFPTIGGFQGTYLGRGDAFVVKLTASGNDLVYATFLGEAGTEFANGVVADSQGNAYVTGLTTSYGFPTSATAYQKEFSGRQDAWVTKLSPFGNQIRFSTYLGINDSFESGTAIGIDSLGQPIVTGTTTTTEFPTTVGAFDRTFNGGTDVFVAKFNATASELQFSTFLGGNLDEVPNAMVIDPAGEIYVVGFTSSADFPTTAGAYDTTANGLSDGFITRMSADGRRLVFSTFLGGGNGDTIYGLELEPGGRILVAGQTQSTNFPVSDLALQRTLAGETDAFVTRLNSIGSFLIASTYLGTIFFEEGRAIKAGDGGFPILVGYSESNNFPVTQGAIGVSGNSNGDGFMTIFDPLLNRYSYSTVLGGSGSDQPFAMALDFNGDVYITGRTRSNNFPVTSGALQTTPRGLIDGFVMRINDVLLSECVSPVTPLDVAFPAAGGNSGITIQGGCPWHAFASAPWINITSPRVFLGQGSLNYTVAGNAAAAPRTAAVYVAGNLNLLIQKGTDQSAPFADVSAADPLADHVRVIKSRNVTLGCGPNIYCPNSATTRGEMAAFIIRAVLGTDDFPVSQQAYFADVPSTHIFFRHIQKMRELNITLGCGSPAAGVNNYCPNDPVTRGQMAAFLVRAKFGATFTNQTIPYFTDVPSSNQFFPHIQKLRQYGVTLGCGGGRYCVNESTTRLQMAAFLTRMFFTPW